MSKDTIRLAMMRWAIEQETVSFRLRAPRQTMTEEQVNELTLRLIEDDIALHFPRAPDLTVRPIITALSLAYPTP